jgi:transmembrane protein EpsG
MLDVIVKIFTEGLVYLYFFCMFYVFTVLESSKVFYKYRNVTAFISIFCLTLFTGLRWGTGTDWKSYYNLFQNVDIDFGYLFLVQIYSFDFGYVLLNILVNFFSNSYTVFLLLDSLIALGLVYFFIKKYSPNPNISLFVFYNAFFISTYMGSNRRIVALGLSLFAISSLIKKRNSLFFSGMAFLFHKSSIIVLISHFVSKIRLSTKKILIILLVSLILGLFQIPLKFLTFISELLTSFSGYSIVDKLTTYTIESDKIELGNRDPIMMMFLSIVKRCVFLIFYLFIINKKKGKLDYLSDYFLNIYIIGFSLYLFLNGSEVIQVSSSYFTFIEIVVIGRFWYYANKNQKLIFLPILFFYGFFQLVSSLTAYPELYMPYKFILTDG